MGTAWSRLGSRGGSGGSKCSASSTFFSALQLASQWLTALIQALRDVQAASTSACAGDSPGGSKRRTATGSPRSPAADGEGSPGGPAGVLRAFFGQRLSGERGSLKRSASAAAQPVCLICLDALEPEDFESGEAIVLECQCRGELALRHRTCAEKWARVKVRGA